MKRAVPPSNIREATVGWIGLGRMGSAMVERLLDAGITTAVYNRTPEKARPFVDRGATQLASVTETATRDIVFSMVSDDAALAALHDPDSGLFADPTTRRTTVWIDGSTVSPAAARGAAAAAHAAGAAFVSAPVSGNPEVVRAGNAIFVVSGDAAALDVTEELLGVLGRAVFRAGEGTEAVTIKLCVNALLATTMQSLSEITVLAGKSGVARAALLAFLNDSAIGSPFTRYKTPNLVALDFEPTFTAVGQRKDIRLALSLAAENEVPMPLLSTTETAFSRLVSSGLGPDRDIAGLLLTAARDAGYPLRGEDTE